MYMSEELTSPDEYEVKKIGTPIEESQWASMKRRRGKQEIGVISTQCMMSETVTTRHP